MKWLWEKCVKEAVKVKNYVTDVPRLKKLCKRFAESEKFVQQRFWMGEIYMRCTECKQLCRRYNECNKIL